MFMLLNILLTNLRIYIRIITAMKMIFVFIFLVVAASCIDPYIPNLKNFKSMLVVEGLITNENSSNKIKLCRTTIRKDSVPEMITDADVYITDGDGIKTHLQNCDDGYYKTDSTSFAGVIGQKYTLQILTSDGKEYKSEECSMIPVAGIDTIYYEKSQEISGNPGQEFTGIKIFLNSTDATGMNQYFRWTFEEVWKFILPFPPEYTYAYINDTTFYIESVPAIRNVCWNKNKSGEILTNSILSGGVNYINKQRIQFIAPVKSNRLTLQYSILVKQYSVSKKEYDFWNNLKKASEAGGDIFGSQPYTVISNIHNVIDAGEMVLGYFEVSALRQKRIYITTSELEPLDLPPYKTDCAAIAKSPDDWPIPETRPTWDAIYHMFMDTGDFTFVMPDVTPGTILAGRVYQKNLLEFVFTPKVCSLCEYTGFTAKPDFWIDEE
jgi:hypothetical protein